MGETIEGNARFIITAAPMATGGYGQEAVFGYDANQRNQAGPTVSDVHQAVAEVERTVWDNDAERAENQERIGRVINRYEEACDAAERAGFRVFRSQSSCSQTRTNRFPGSVRNNETTTRTERNEGGINGDNTNALPIPDPTPLPIPDPTPLPIPDPSVNAKSRESMEKPNAR